MSLEIRPLKVDDLDPLYPWIENNPLFKKYGTTRAKLGPALERAVVDPGSVVVGAFAEGRLRGFAWFIKKGAFDRSGYLRLIAVDPTETTKGVGRALMEYLEKAFLRPGGIFLLATDVNRDAHVFYSRLGYRKVGEIPDYVAPGLHEWIFHKPPPTSP